MISTNLVTNAKLFILLGICLSIILFCLRARADDALVLPHNAWRFYLIPAWTTIKANFDAAGERQVIASGAGRMKAFNLGYAIEYGINRWLTTGIQWSPGTTLSSALDFPAGDAQRRDRARVDQFFVPENRPGQKADSGRRS